MGGDTLGMRKAGVEVIGFNENNKTAIESHKKNFGNCDLIGSIQDKFNILNIKDELGKYAGEVDIIFARISLSRFFQGR